MKKISDKKYFKDMDFCCGIMEGSVTLEENKRKSACIIFYRAERDYGIVSLNGEEGGINYCPFCGSKLGSLNEEWWDTVYLEYGGDYLEDSNGNPPKKELPEEFKTDEWWKKRGL